MTPTGKREGIRGTITVKMADQTYTDPQKSPSWFPSADEHSPTVFQGSTPVPDLCHGGQMTLKQGGTFSAKVGSTDQTDKVNIRWHYSANGKGGDWSVTKSVVPS